MLLTKPERLALIYQRLTDAPPAENRPGALALLKRVFQEVEDEHSGVPDEPDHPDRMHPPVADMEEDIPGQPAAKRYRHKRHYTVIAGNGAFESAGFYTPSMRARGREPASKSSSRSTARMAMALRDGG